MSQDTHPLLPDHDHDHDDMDNSVDYADQRKSEHEWVLYIKNELKEAKNRLSAPNPSIFMASSPLRGLKLEAFIPQVVSIGPFHNDLGPHHSLFPHTLETKRYKLIAAQEMDKHKIVAGYLLSKYLPGGDLVSLADRFQEIASEIREEYDTDLSECVRGEEKLAYMMAVDSAFVVEFLRCNISENTPGASARSGGNTSSNHEAAGGLRQAAYKGYYTSRFPRPLRKSILQDFMLLENQLPMKVLWEVVRMDKRCRGGDEEAEGVLGALVRGFAAEVLPFSVLSSQVLEEATRRVGRSRHLLDCLYEILTYKPAVGSPGSGKYGGSIGGGASDGSRVELKPTHFPSATELHNCGVSIRPSQRGAAGNMSSIHYDHAHSTLYVPVVRVGDETGRLFRNLIAYESHLIDEVSVVSYFRFMNMLVDTADDVALLVQKGVLAQDIGSNHDVAEMWNNLCINTMRVCCASHERIAQQLSRHCAHRTNALKAEFKRTYLSRPWLLISVLSAAALLIMTLVITYYTVLIYLKDE